MTVPSAGSPTAHHTQPSPLASEPISVAELEMVVTRMREGVMGLDAQRCICLCNPTAAHMLGQAHDDLLGKDMLAAVPHPELHGLIRSLDTVTNDSVSRQLTIEVGGAARLLNVVIHRVEDPASPRIRHVVYVEDVTEIAHSARMKADFVANASHELRTPLSTLQAASETLLQSADRLDAHQRRFLEVISKNVERLGELARDLLELNRVETPGLPVHIGAVDLRAVVEEIRRDYAAKLSSRDLTFTVALDRPTLRADRKLLKLILTNLIDNAVKFVKPQAGRIAVRSAGEDGEAWLEVADNGIGIAAVEQQRIFERFYQVDRARQESGAAGTGLGLAIVKHATAAMGGRIELHSTVGQGTTVQVRLPQDSPPGG